MNYAQQDVSGMDIVQSAALALFETVTIQGRKPFTIQELYKFYDVPYEEENKLCFSQLELLCSVAAGLVSATTNENSVVVNAVDTLLLLSSGSRVVTIQQ